MTRRWISLVPSPTSSTFTSRYRRAIGPSMKPDPPNTCVAVRAVPVVEGAVALALLELWLERRASLPLTPREDL